MYKFTYITIDLYFEMKRKLRYEVCETILITLTFIIIPKFVVSHPVEEYRDETLRQQRHSIFEPQSVVDYVDDGSFEFGFDLSTSFPKREAKTTQVTTVQVAVTTTEVTTTEFSATEAETSEPPTVVPKPKKREEHNFECYFVGNVGVISHCVRYLACSKIGAMPEPLHCLTGEHFDLKKRLCVDKEEAECDSDKICPDDQTEYSMDNGDLKCNDGVPFPKNETQVVEAPKPKSEDREGDEIGDPNEEILPMVKRGMEDEANNPKNIERVAGSEGIINRVTPTKDSEGIKIGEANSKDSEGIINVVLTAKDSEAMTNAEAKSKNIERIEVTTSPIVEGIIIGIPKAKSAERMNGTNGPLIEGFIIGLNSEGTEGNGVRVAKSSDDGKDDSNAITNKGSGTSNTTIIEVNELFNLTGNEGDGVNNSKRSANGEGVHRTTGDGTNSKSTVINIMVAVDNGDIGLPRPGTKKKDPQIIHVKVIQAGNVNKKITGINETLAKQIGKKLTEALEKINNRTNQQSKNDVKGNGKQRAELQAKLDAKLKANSSSAAGSNTTSNPSFGNSDGGATAVQQQQLENMMMLRDKSKGQVSEVKVIKMENGKEKSTKMNEALINQVGVQLMVAALSEGKPPRHQGHNVMMMNNRTYSSSEQTWNHGIPQKPLIFSNTTDKSPGLAGHHVRHNF